MWLSCLSHEFTGSHTQTTIAHLPREKLVRLEIPLPPLAEQERIAARLTEQLAVVERARLAAQARLAAARSLPAAYLREIFEHDNDRSWTRARVGDFCTIVRGSSPRPKGDTRFYGGIVPRLMVEDCTRDGMFVTPKIDFLTHAGAQRSRPMKSGDIVIVVSGNPGLPAILAIDCCIHDGFVGLRNVSERIDKTYVYYFLLFNQSKTDAGATGAIFRNLTTTQIGALQIDLPPLEEQRRRSAYLRHRGNAASLLLAPLKANLEQINALPAALLREAFGGQTSVEI